VPRFTPEPQIAAKTYWSREYNTKARICSFWHQLDEILMLGARTVLEVGPGSGIVTEWLRREGISVTTLDMDPAVPTDVHGSVTELPFGDDSFDATLCCQVLEHMPFEQSERAIGELIRVARQGAVISVPDATPWAGVAYPVYFPGWYLLEARQRMPTSRLGLVHAVLRRRYRLRDWLFLRLVPARWELGGPVREFSRLPIPRGRWRPERDSQHYWEVGAEAHPLERLLGSVERAGGEVERNFRVPENPWHRFLTLRPR
jgi:SAM-dependent methyltransferase